MGFFKINFLQSIQHVHAVDIMISVRGRARPNIPIGAAIARMCKVGRAIRNSNNNNMHGAVFIPQLMCDDEIPGAYKERCCITVLSIT